MNFKRFILLLAMLVLNQYAWAADCTAPDFTLEHNKWEMIALPCTPAFREDSVAQVFGSKLVADNYDVTWVVYSWNGTEYVKMDANGGSQTPPDFLRQGYGYWIIQVTGNSVKLNMPDDALATEPPRCNPNDATVTARCIDISPTEKDGAVGWTMLGNPYNEDFPVDRLRVQANLDGLVPPGAPGLVGSSLEEANQKRVFNAEIFRYNGEGYESLSGSQSLSAWDGFWGATLEDAFGRETMLRFTKEPPAQ